MIPAYGVSASGGRNGTHGREVSRAARTGRLLRIFLSVFPVVGAHFARLGRASSGDPGPLQLSPSEDGMLKSAW